MKRPSNSGAETLAPDLFFEQAGGFSEVGGFEAAIGVKAAGQIVFGEQFGGDVGEQGAEAGKSASSMVTPAAAAWPPIS